MTRRGVYDRMGELIGYVEGARLFDRDGALTGAIRGRTVYDLADRRQWLLDGDAVLDLRGNVIGYLGEPVPLDDYEQ